MSGPHGHVLVVGDIMDDIIVRPHGPLVRGSDRRAAIRRLPGGSAANQAVWLAAMGVPVTLAARVGSGDLVSLEAHFRGRGVVPLLTADVEAPTGTIVTILDADGERSFLTDRGANARLNQADLPEAVLEDADMLVLSGYAFFEPAPRQAVRALAAAARGRGLPVAVDPASTGFLAETGPENVLDWMNDCDLVFANAEEAAILTGSDDLDTQIRRLARHGRAIVKCGAAGAALGDRGGVRHVLPAPEVEVLDTTGAGDAFAAAFIAAERAGHGEHEALAAAIACGSRAVGRLGGQPDHPRQLDAWRPGDLAGAP